MICPNCKKRIAKGDKFCGYCGYKLKTEDIEFSTWPRPKESEFFAKPSPEEFTPEKEPLNYAGFWIRFGAYLIDNVIILIISVLFVVYFFGGIFWEEYLDQLISILAIIIYHTLFLSIYSSTPGKILYGLEVIDANTKEKIQFGKALGRSLSYIISSLIFGLGFLAIAIDKEKHRGWHDKIAKTLVIKKKKKSLTLPIILSIISIVIIGVLFWYSESEYKYPFEELFTSKESTYILNTLQNEIYQQTPNFQSLLKGQDKVLDLSKEILTKTTTSERKTAEQIFENYSKAVVTIGIEDWYGDFGFASGFLISPTGLLVTNYHVVEDASKIAVALINKKIDIYEISSVIVTDLYKDIAILRIRGQNLPYVTLGDSDLMKVGQKVFAIGNPAGFTNTISDGIISQIRELSEGVKLFQTTVPISMGSSGGALFNEIGEVIGIINTTFLWGQNINFAVPINYVKDLIGLTQNISGGKVDETSNLIFCNDTYWQPCPIGQKFHCPKKGNPFCCPGTILNDECCTGIVCNNKCWAPCEVGYKFYCPPKGDPYCEPLF